MFLKVKFSKVNKIKKAKFLLQCPEKKGKRESDWRKKVLLDIKLRLGKILLMSIIGLNEGNPKS